MNIPELDAFLERTGLVKRDVPRQLTPLTGGVSSDIWRVELPAGAVCVKRAPPEWHRQDLRPIW